MLSEEGIAPLTNLRELYFYPISVIEICVHQRRKILIYEALNYRVTFIAFIDDLLIIAQIS